MSKISIFIFRRSFRLYDNIGLINALKNSKKVIPIFIFTPEQIKKNQYKSNNAIQFMIESLKELDKELKKKKSKLYFFYGKQHKIISKINKEIEIDSVYLNKDYTPYAIKRDKKIKKICSKNNINYFEFEDILLRPVGSIKTNDNIYLKFTPYFRASSKIKVNTPTKNLYSNYFKKKIKCEYKKDIDNFYKFNEHILIRGGRKEALLKLNKINNFKKYNDKRNILSISTTHLSAYIKFGCISIREVYHKFKKKLQNNNQLISQLHWRDFYYNICFYHPHVIGKSLKSKYDDIEWDNNSNLFNKWKEGKTGYPVVDACMRELNTTGYMHNRGRLIVASFLVKILLVDWRKGEKYFATQLTDYDVSVNNGNWQWVAGSGADSQPYFRIFNPWSQSKKFDENCEYIKKWIPELSEVKNNDIHKWDLKYNLYNKVYIKPIVNYKEKRLNTLKIYKKLKY